MLFNDYFTGGVTISDFVKAGRKCPKCTFQNDTSYVFYTVTPPIMFRRVESDITPVGKQEYYYSSGGNHTSSKFVKDYDIFNNTWKRVSCSEIPRSSNCWEKVKKWWV